MEKELELLRKQRWKNFIIIMLILVIVGIPLFGWWKIQTDARIAFREAKNIKLTLQMLDIQAYGENRCIYDEHKPDGLAEGVLSQVEALLEHEADVKVLSYDRTMRQVTSFQYSWGHYLVTYEYTKTKGDQWKIEYLITVNRYESNQEE